MPKKFSPENLMAAKARLERENEALKKSLRESRRPLKIRELKRGRESDYYYRLIIPDSHGNFIDEYAAQALCADMDLLGLRNDCEIVRLGDHLECGGWLAEKFTLGYVAEVQQVSFERDVKAANWFLDETQKRAHGAKDYFLEGNHEKRLEAWIVTQTLRHPQDAEYLRTIVGPEIVLNLKQRGIEFVRHHIVRPGERFPGLLRLGKCGFSHGWVTGKNAARGHAETIGGNIVYGHVHKEQFYQGVNQYGTFGAWCPGSLCRPQPLWMHNRPSDWSLGYGLQIVDKNTKDFLHINIPIIRGKSFMLPLIKGILK